MNPQEVIDYWYSDQVRSQWFSSTPELDAEIRSKYETVWERAVEGELDGWKKDALGSLALVLIFDQFPLNMFRGEAKSFKTEGDAIEVARASINNGFVPQLNDEQLSFLFMPFMHSEKIEDQDLAVKLFRENELEGNLEFAKHHRDIIRKFGRFPHRNRILGRESTVKELEYLGSKGSFNG
ncbi:uncharacterized protein (DUF924 family) [Thiogranum longum]|uniref:Uncharacterized protein (DUF924 family) n=1 Tax=Thiogranum longum TaxID=1537524 RepID=A0A4R1HBU6_9GAMM|nr:DUF924 family protein [Thiogranum longum]TCK17650.1 uncharacterized protein (DUF924 family) [Thiogranum longum]